MEFYPDSQNYLEEFLGLREMEYHCTLNHDFTTNVGWTTILDGFSAPFYGGAAFGDDLSPPDFTSDSSTTILNSQTLPYFDYQVPDPATGCKVEPEPEPEPVPELPTFKERKMKKMSGQPSKNLMAERRRRKRLNDRLSMLRSVVPKITKMDRTSILGDTIDYMKELLEKINNLQQEMDLGANELGLLSIFNNVKPEEIFVRNSPKFEVERRANSETKIEIFCAGKPGLLLSTVATIEAMGMDIQQGVISCFSDFAMQASCSEEMEQRAFLNSDNIKQALLRNAGYGAKCLN